MEDIKFKLRLKKEYTHKNLSMLGFVNGIYTRKDNNGNLLYRIICTKQKKNIIIQLFSMNVLGSLQWVLFDLISKGYLEKVYE